MKTFNFFEKLWEHSRTLRRVGLVLVMCLITIPQAWGYTATFRCVPALAFGSNWSEGNTCKVKYDQYSSGSGADLDWITLTLEWKGLMYESSGNLYKIYEVTYTSMPEDGAKWLSYERWEGSTYKEKTTQYNDWKNASWWSGNLRTDSWTSFTYKTWDISSGTTIVWDAGQMNWGGDGHTPQIYIYKSGYNDGGTNLTKIGGSQQYYKTYASAWEGYGGFLFRGHSDFNNGQTTNIPTDVSSSTNIVLFTHSSDGSGNGSYTDGKADWQKISPAYKGTSGQTIYFDNTLTNWSNVYFKYGTPYFNRSIEITSNVVSGTNGKLLYITLPQDIYYGQFMFADGYGYTNYWPIDDSHCSHYTALQASHISAAKTYIPTANAQKGATDVLTGYQRTVTIASSSNGTVNVSYTDNGGSSKSKTSGNFKVQQACVITVTATANTGYELTSLTVGSDAINSGDTYAVRADKTVTAVFSAKSYSNTLNANGGSGGSSSVTTTYNSSSISDISNPTNDGYEFSGWYSGSGGTGTMVIDAAGHLQPNSAYTNASCQWTNNGAVTLYAGWLRVHTPGTYIGTYGKDLTMYSCEQYELYGVSKTNSTTTYRITAGEKVNVNTDYSSAANKVLTYNSTTLVRDGWIEGCHNSAGSGGSLNTYEFSSFPTSSTHYLTMQSGQYLQFCVSGYSGFSIIAKDYNTTDKYFKVEVDGVPDESVSKYSSGSGSVRRYTLSSSSSNHIIKITAIGGNTSQFYGFSLKLPDYPAPSALAASDITSSGATLTVTDSYETNNYEFYVNTSSAKPAANASANYTSTSTTKTIDDLSSGTTYYAWVRSKCSSTRKSDWVALTGNTFTTSAVASTYSITYECYSATSGCPSNASDQTALPNPLPSAPTKNGYTFGGWYTDDTFETEAVAGATLDDDVTLYAKWTCTTPTISNQPGDATVCKDASSPTLSVTASANGGSLSYQWYSNTTKAATVDNEHKIAGATNASYAAPTSAAGTKYYYCVVTNTTGSCSTAVTSDIATVTIKGAATITWGTQPANGTVGDDDFAYAVSCSDGSSVTVTSNNTDVATIVDGKLHYVAAGTTYLIATATDACGNEIVQNSNNFTVSAALSSEKKLLGLKFSNGFDALINESSHTVQAYYLNGTSAPTITSHTESAAATYSMEGNTITITAENGTTQDYELTLSTVTPYAGTGSEETFTGSETYIKGGRWESSMWTFQKNDGGEREISGRNRLYFFVTACEKITLKSGGDSRAMKVYRNGVELVTPTASGSSGSTIDIEGTAGAAMYALVSNQTSGSGKFSSITITPRCADPGLAYATGSVTRTLCDDLSYKNTLTNSHNVAVTYTSSNTSVATVAADGTLTIKAAGTTTITASSVEQTISTVTYCADEASYTLTVNASTAAGLAYGTSTIKKDVGDANFTNTLTNSHSLDVTYESSNTSVATVDEDGEVTIVGAGTTTITASSAQQKVSSTCYAAGSATYTLTVYPVYTVTYNAMGGTCSPTSTNTTTALGKVTLPSATHASYTTYSWVTSDGTEAGDAGDTYTPEGNINLYAKWSGSCAGGGGSKTVLFKAQAKTSGMPSSLSSLASNTSLTTDNYLSVLDGGTFTLNVGTAGHVKANKDSLIQIANTAAYFTITLSGGKALQAGDIITTRLKGHAGYLQTGSGSYSVATDISLACDVQYTTTVTSSMVGASTIYLKAASNNMNFAYVEIYRPAEKLLYMQVNEGLTNGSIDTEETKQTAGESNLLKVVSGGDVYTGATTDGHLKIVNTKEIQLSGNTGYLKLVLPKVLAKGDILSFNSSVNYQISFTTSKSYGNTIGTSNKSYTIPTGSGLIGQSTIYVWYYSASNSTNIKNLAVVRPEGGSSCKTVTYNGNGADGGYTNDPTQYTSGQSPEILDCGYTRTGYAFMGWADGTDHRDAGTVDYQPSDIIRDISSDVTLYAIWKQIKYFTGAASTTSWNTDGNWSPSGVPARTDPVVIQANVTVDINNAKALRVDIETGNTLTINAGMALIIAETLTKNGSATEAADVVINSDRTTAGVGALIIGGETGTNKATVNFETRVKRESGTGNWINQFIGSPFSDLEPYVDYALQIYEFRPASDGNRGFWHKLSSGDRMEAFWGYNVLYNDNDYLNVQWTGTLNASSNNVTKTGSNAVQTDNLFANSWVAPIHIAAFEEGDFTNFDPTIYIFNAGTPQQEQEMSSDVNANTAAGTYATIPINSSSWLGGTLKVIPAMQAFFVKATGASPRIKLDYSKLVYTPALTSVDITPTRAPRRSAEVAPEVIRLHVAGENGWAENTYVLGREDFTEGYDRGWDGRYMEGEDTNPQLYTPTTDGYMAVNCVPEIEGTVVGFRKGSSDNNYIFSFDYDGDEVWYLNDQKAQKSTQIMNGQTYAFESEAGDNAARFVISATPINKIATGCESVGAEAAKVRKVIIDDKVYIIRGGQVFDVLGKTIKK